jgi:UDP-N-acetylglucosamine 2-epimerase
VTVVGARPQFIKVAPVSRALRREHREILVHTVQHYVDAMPATFLRELGIPEPDHNLEVGSGSHGRQTGRMLEAIESVLLAERPDWVLVYGDTNSTLAGALAAAKLDIPVAHVEAGVRSYNRTMAEEVNRTLTDRVARLLFCPTSLSLANLGREGITEGVRHVGDVMLEVLLTALPVARDRSTILADLGIRSGRYVLLTLHRAENVDRDDGSVVSSRHCVGSRNRSSSRSIPARGCVWGCWALTATSATGSGSYPRWAIWIPWFCRRGRVPRCPRRDPAPRDGVARAGRVGRQPTGERPRSIDGPA